VTFALLSPEIVEAIHDAVLNPGELAGRARDKSLEGALARVDRRLDYGLIHDAFDLAAAYAVAIAQGIASTTPTSAPPSSRCRRLLEMNGDPDCLDTEETGQWIIRAAQGQAGEAELAGWLRARAGQDG
jgi:death on curing protein